MANGNKIDFSGIKITRLIKQFERRIDNQHRGKMNEVASERVVLRQFEKKLNLQHHSPSSGIKRIKLLDFRLHQFLNRTQLQI